MPKLGNKNFEEPKFMTTCCCKIFKKRQFLLNLNSMELEIKIILLFLWQQHVRAWIPAACIAFPTRKRNASKSRNSSSRSTTSRKYRNRSRYSFNRWATLSQWARARTSTWSAVWSPWAIQRWESNGSKMAVRSPLAPDSEPTTTLVSSRWTSCTRPSSTLANILSGPPIILAPLTRQPVSE